MRKILVSIAATILIIVSPLMQTAKAADTLKVIEANDEGIVTVPKSVSPDGMEHTLVKIEPEAAAAVQSVQGVTTFATLDYRSGLFDKLATSLYTINYSQVKDNNLTTAKNIVNETILITFAEKMNIDALYFYGATSRFNFDFYLDGKVIYKFTGAQNGLYTTLPKRVTTDRIDIYYKDNSGKNVGELEFFGDVIIEYIAAGNVQIDSISETAATLSYTKPKSNFYTKSAVYLDGKLIYNGTNEKVSFTDLTSNTNYTVKIRSYYTDGNYIDTETTFSTLKDTEPPGKITNLKAVQTADKFKLTYTFPTDKDFSHVEIYRNNLLIGSNVKEEAFTDDQPIKNSNNTYKVIAIDKSGNKSEPGEITVKHVGVDVYDVKAVAKDFTAVELSWKNPTRTDFEKVTIYRKDPDVGLLARAISFLSLSDGYTPLFETNGTVFKDLTVEADTSYSYKITSTVSDEETDGVIVNIKTPKLAVVGGQLEQTENKDYVFKWSAPTNGKVKILIADKEYKTVEASTQQITIPMANMKFDILGAPLVSVVPINEDGTEGEKTKPPGTSGSNSDVGGTNGKIEMPSDVSAMNVLKVAIALLGLVGMFVLLGLAFKVVPKLVKTIRTSYEGRANNGK